MNSDRIRPRHPVSPAERRAAARRGSANWARQWARVIAALGAGLCGAGCSSPGADASAAALDGSALARDGNVAALDGSALALDRSATAASLGTARPALTRGDAACATDPRVTAGLVSADVCAGAKVFFEETFEGNGRTCGTCHRVEDNYTIDPVLIERLPDSDPLFVGERTPELAGLESVHLRDGHALIQEHVDGADGPFVLRSVQHLLSIGTTLAGPAGQRTGWSGDGAPNGELSGFLDGAIREHLPKRLAREAGVDFRRATPDEIREVELFERSLGRTRELELASVRLVDEFAEQGRQLFLEPSSHCNECHGNAGANPTTRPDSNFDTGVERAFADGDLEFARLDGSVVRDGGFGLAAQPAAADSIAFGDGTFNVPSLIEAADTGPFFHDNANPADPDGSGIGAVIGFYNGILFNTSPAAAQVGNISLPGETGAQVGAFLRVLNGAFNLGIATQRLRAAELLTERDPAVGAEIQIRLVELAGEELDDALRVLTANEGPPMYPDAVSALRAARSDVSAAATPDAAERLERTRAARALIEPAAAALGQNLDFDLGEGNLMF